MATRTLSVEVNKFFQIILLNEKLRCFSKQSYSEARMKLKSEAYVQLNDRFVSEFYSRKDFEEEDQEPNDYRTYKGYRLIAIDTSKLRLPNTKENIREFGQAENGGGKTVPMARASVALDCLNEICLDSILGENTSSEGDLALGHIEKIIKDCIKTIFIMDRGYPSLLLFVMALKLHFDYLIRYNGENFIGELKDFAVDPNLKDSVITIDLVKKYKAGYKWLKPFIDEGITSIKLRVVKIHLSSSGETEYLVTSLLQKEFSRGELKDIYNIRWTDETYFNYQKNVVEMENFSGKKPENIRQDFYSKILVSNIAQLIALEAESQLAEGSQIAESQIEEEELKDSRKAYESQSYKVNKTVLTGMMKDDIVRMLFSEGDSWTKQFNYLVEVAKRNKTTVHMDRHFQRKKSKRLSQPYLYKRKAL